MSEGEKVRTTQEKKDLADKGGDILDHSTPPPLHARDHQTVDKVKEGFDLLDRAEKLWDGQHPEPTPSPSPSPNTDIPSGGAGGGAAQQRGIREKVQPG
jgi:hypothetical protein